MLTFAFRNLLSRPARSLLSLLGLTVAIMGMVGLFSVAEGLDKMFRETFDSIPGLVAMQPGAPIPLFSRVPAAWGDEISDVPGVGVVNPEVWQRANIIDGVMPMSPPRFLFGMDIESRLQLKRAVYKEALTEGRFLTPDDRLTNHTLISRPIAEEYGKGVGETLRVNGYDLEIVGIYHCDQFLLDVAIIVDINQLRRMTRFDPQSVSAFYIEPDGTVENDALADAIRDVFRGREIDPWRPGSLDGGAAPTANPLSEFFRSLDRTLKGQPAAPSDADPQATDPRGESATPSRSPVTAPPGDDAATPLPSAATGGSPPAGDSARFRFGTVDESAPLEVRSANDWGERFNRMAAELDLILLVLTGIGITIAVLSIVNTMLMSVTERIIEFGILKANGWSRGDVLRLITCESALLGVAGGVLGSLAGWGGTHVINAIWPTRAHLFASPQLLIFAILFSTVLGVLGGLYPAVWAMRMLPMDAIRRG